MQVIHDLNMGVIFSKNIPDSVASDIADIVNKVLTKHDLLELYQNYVKIKYSKLPLHYKYERNINIYK